MVTFKQTRQNSRQRLLLLGATAVAFALVVTATARAAKPNRVLLIYSFGNAAGPTRAISVAFEAELAAKMGEPIDLDQVSLDMARYTDADMQEAVVDFLQKRQAKWQPDMVVTMGAPAAIFVAKNRERLFPDAAIIYASLDRRLLPAGALEKNAAYVGQVFDARGWIEDMLQIAPATKNIEVVVGATPLERGWQDTFQKAAESFAGRIKFTYYNDLSYDQMRQRVAKLPRDSYIFFLLLRRDALGVAYDSDEALERLHEIANAPINSVFRYQLGMGIVGGRLYQSDLIGKEAANVAIRILHGEPASSFAPLEIDPLPPHYDWRELRRWKIDEKLLPPGSTVLFREPTLAQRYKGWIIGGISLLGLQALLITGLVANLIRRRRAEGSLVESEQRFQTMANAAPVMIWMSGSDKLCTFLNKAWLDFRGRVLEQDIGFGWKEGIHPEDLQDCVQAYESAFDARQPFAVKFRLLRHDGEYRWITAQGIPRYDAAGNFTGYVGACVDMNDLLEKDEALHEIEERVSLATEAAHLGVWELDCRTKQLWVSDKVRELFQFEPNQPVSYEAFQARVHPDDRARREAAVGNAIQTKGHYEIEYRLLFPNGSVRWLAGRGRCISDGDGRSCRLLAVSTDITARKLAEEEAKRNREQFELLGRVSLLGEMTASLAHELNQPLTAIVNNASAGMRFIEKGDVDPKTLHEIMVDVVADGRRAHEIIHGVRQTIKKGPAIRQRIDLNATIGKVVHMVQPDALAQSCEMETSLTEHSPEIEGDPVQIQQVFINLLSNAFDAMHDTAPKNRKVKITTEGNGEGTVCVSVRDRGPGIPGEARDHLFEQFFTTKDDGLGMGLSIVRTIIEAHGGKIDADNAEGGGARFFFTLPTTKENLS